MTPAALTLALLLDPLPSAERAFAIDANVAALSNGRYVVREAAAKRLVEAGGAAKWSLRKAVKNPDPEVSRLAGTALERIIAAEVESLRPFPEIDAAWWSVEAKAYSLPADPVMRGHLNAVGQDPRPWANYYQATENWARGLLTAGLAPRTLRPFLAEMHRRDAVFLLGHKDWATVGPWPVDHDWYRNGGK